jgi:hypothetical protein
MTLVLSTTNTGRTVGPKVFAACNEITSNDMMKMVYVIPILAAVLGLITTTMQQSAHAHTLAWRFGYENGQQSGREGTG